jgi:glycosyltransferase involved in cell wall biosynthesis
VLKTSPRVLARRILGRRVVFLLRNILSEVSFRLGLYSGPLNEGREFGVSAMVCTYNEEDWVIPSLLSVRDLVDEYVVVDSSTDRTPELINRLKEDEGLYIKMIRISPGDLAHARIIAIKNARYSMILHLDADFVYFDWAPKYIRGFIEGLDKRKHYLLYWPLILLCGDLKHMCEEAYHIEHWLFTYSNKLTYKYLYVDGTPFDHLIAPIHLYKALMIDKPMGLHLTGVRKPAKVAYKHLWYLYRDEFQKLTRTGEDPIEIAKRKALELYGTDDLEEFGRRIISEQVSKLPVYTGEYPSILLKYLNYSLEK